MKAWSIIAYFATLKRLSARTTKTRVYELLEPRSHFLRSKIPRSLPAAHCEKRGG